MTEMNTSKLKVLFIDWFNTLTSRAFLHKLRQDNPQLFSRIDQKIFDQSPTGWHLEWARGKIGQEEVAEIIAQDVLLSKEEVLDIFADCCKHQDVDNEEIWEVIARIRKRGVKVVLATDNWDIFCRYTIPALSLERHFDDILSSDTVGFLKRDADGGKLLFFEEYLRKNGIDYEECLLIDDSPANISRCCECGLPVLKVSSPIDTLIFLKELEEKL